jgi:hypothetical protein
MLRVLNGLRNGRDITIVSRNDLRYHGDRHAVHNETSLHPRPYQRNSEIANIQVKTIYMQLLQVQSPRFCTPDWHICLLPQIQMHCRREDRIQSSKFLNTWRAALQRHVTVMKQVHTTCLKFCWAVLLVFRLAFAQSGNVTIKPHRVRPSVCPHASERILLDVFSWNLTLGTSTKIPRCYNLVNIGHSGFSRVFILASGACNHNGHTQQKPWN